MMPSPHSRGFISSLSIARSISGCLLILCFSCAFADHTDDKPGIPVSDESSTSGIAESISDPSNTNEKASLHGQFTNVYQWHDSFKAPYTGANSLTPQRTHAQTNDLTLYAGIRLWQGGELYINPEIDEGFGLSNTLGLAGFASGEAYKVGKAYPYLRFQRLFFRQVINLDGEQYQVESAANQLAGSRSSNNIVFTAGKLSVVDIFDTNSYAHDPRSDFLNWSILDAGAFDYAADSWGYTYGAAAEWNQSRWTLRGGLFDLSKIPNNEHLEKDFRQYSLIGELEERHDWLGHPGKFKLLVFDNRGYMANYSDAVKLGLETSTTPDVALVRHFNSRKGLVINLEQAFNPNIGIFARASINDGSKEAFEFTDINKSVEAGLSIRGGSWNRPNDTVGIAGVINGISDKARTYFASGGLGILIGDGQLVHYGTERILEAYYSTQICPNARISLDYQHIDNPSYNQDRGPVSIIGFRFHAEL